MLPLFQLCLPDGVVRDVIILKSFAPPSVLLARDEVVEEPVHVDVLIEEEDVLQVEDSIDGLFLGALSPRRETGTDVLTNLVQPGPLTAGYTLDYPGSALVGADPNP
jgi:hypothetical protein